ncbi:NADPH:quinone reductase [Methylobacter tundripaludum SV96]|uniref:NADPH:quinone reductase n=2 Tax=Methylobacter tundripaludum TaxID=173365 RepID=G3IU38_METTV|nr:NADPH:quinone reductase [Methylobacter tundripaludum SV96]
MTINSRSYRFARSGGASNLVRCNNTMLSPGPREVLIRVSAASLNYRDLLTLQDINSNHEGLIPLSDCAGTIVDVGTEVARWKEGDRVSLNFFPDWHDGACSLAYLQRSLGGGQTNGVLSDFIVAEETSLVEITSHLTLSEAATLPCAGLTAWQALFERGALKAGETVLVQGTGGVALFGLQLAAAQGAQVIVISSSDAKLERARTLGAWQTINYCTQPEWDKVALELTDGKGMDHILELGGPETYDRSIAAIAAGGRIAQIGVLTGFASQPNILPLQFKNASINGICVGSVEHFKRLNDFLSDQQIHPVIDQVFDFDEVPAAYERMKSAVHFGKIVFDLA